MSYIFTGCLVVSIFAAILTGSGGALGVAVLHGAQSGITLAISIAGPICLWSGVGYVMEKAGITNALSRLLSPLLYRLFPTARKNTALSGSLSANICANFLGLGNAATPMGIQAAEHLAKGTGGVASDELCRLIVLNTASIQLIPSTVAALRASLGCNTPFDILPAVWVTSLCSAGLGLTAAWLFGKVWRK
jgi:spore maturation protein A